MDTKNPKAQRPEGLAALLGMALEASDAGYPSSDVAIKAVLQAFLADELLERPTIGDACAALAELSCLDWPLRGPQLTQALIRPGASIEVHRSIKKVAKAMAAQKPLILRAIGMAIYYAAIGAALRFHSQRISRLPTERLDKGFNGLADREWMPPTLVEHFRASAAALAESKE